MAWGSVENATQLNLGSSYATVQRVASDWNVVLNPGELAQVILNYNPQTTPSENCDVVIQRTADGTTFESDGEGLRYILQGQNAESDDPVVRSVEITGVYGFRIRARLRDTDDTAGTDDTATLDVDIRKDGVSI